MGMIVETGLGTYGAWQTGAAAQSAHNFNAQVSASNAAQAKRTAQMAEEMGESQAAYQGQKARAEIGAIEAAQGSSGVRVDSGSSQAVVQSAKQLADLDISQVRSNAAREAYGYRVQAANEMAEGILEKYAAKTSKKAGDIKAATTFIGGVNNIAKSVATLGKSGALNR